MINYLIKKSMEYILNTIGVFLIWICVDFKRNEESEIKPFSKDWWIVFAMILVANVLLQIEI
jgi:hypothetical protein